MTLRHGCKVPLLITRFSSTWATSGVQGVQGRIPSYKPPSINTSQSVSITDPYQIYQTYVTVGILERDEAQIRVMKEFQKLYHRVIDYVPPEDLSIKMSLLLRQIELKQAEQNTRSKSPLRFLKKDSGREKQSLVRFLTDEEALLNFPSPQGLLVNGDVGSGKSLLMDIFASSLPHASKMRWHYNNFMLYVYNEIHNIQQQRLKTMDWKMHEFKMENEFILYEIAQKMIQRNTILMLDEFVLPDIASANIIKILFTFYFKLGGVLVATSNKLPEELYSAQFSKGKFKSFVGILNARCISIDINSGKDYRTHFANKSLEKSHLVVRKDNPEQEEEWDRLIKSKALSITEGSLDMDKPLSSLGTPSSVTVYNRTTRIPLTFNNDSICYLDFAEICQGLTSSSDYISIASKYRTIVLDNVPIMTTRMKNEARRFITLLDAIYEAKCQFFMRSQVEVDYLFFPDALKIDDEKFTTYLKLHTGADTVIDRLEVQDEEMYAKTSIAMENPYRPNIASYDKEDTQHYNEPSKINTTKSNFANIKVFTGDDEKFAFKRAVSRIKEMIGSDVWRSSERWVPIDVTMRPWEQQSRASSSTTMVNPRGSDVHGEEQKVKDLLEEKSMKEIRKEISDTLPRRYSQNEGISFPLFNSKVAPVFRNLSHFWAMGPWTSQQEKRLKDAISRSWIRSSARNDKNE
ncbi:hypothetical protein KGF57_000763 [Candida theae]|uniref:AAA+ ATPase domain-containing protein n=1 Tax=Candida theae TaxID=1198502 RepID=A0AAD5BIF3_9ASCO|nr:uncharacterized protein KGF57_000763 [Candida theae]KAI5965497.1 hypothetical protein KGF57_000763 [Candida theae]